MNSAGLKRRSFFSSAEYKQLEMSAELLAAAVHSEPTEANLVHLLDEWPTKWKHKGRTRAVGPGAYEKYCTLGLYAHGGISGISRASNDESAEPSIIS